MKFISMGSWRAAVVALCAGAAMIVCTATAAQVRAFTGATIIDGNGGRPIANGVIVVRDQRIEAVGPRSQVRIPAGAETVDLSGKYVVPGLMDANVHLLPWPSWTYIEFLARYENNFEGIIEEGAQVALKSGLTTVFDSMGPLDPLLAVRDRINRGETEGSRLFVSGTIVGHRSVLMTPAALESASRPFQDRINAMFEKNVGPDLTWKTPEQVYAEMKKFVASVDFVKVGVTGDGKQVNSIIGQHNVLRFTREQQRAMVRAVHEAGKIIQTHQGWAPALHIAVEEDFDMAQHCSSTGESRMLEETIQLMLEKKFYCGTQWKLLSDEDLRRVRENDFPGSDRDNGRGIDYGLENSIRLIKAGVPQLLSTDAGVTDPDVVKDRTLAGRPVAPSIDESTFVAMRAMRQRGMTPMMIIQSATRNIAAAYRKLDDLGTLERGKIADMVVVDADPLQDIENMRKISMVIKDGRTVDREALPRNPILTSPQAQNPGAVRMK